jgi:hypothetical protein
VRTYSKMRRLFLGGKGDVFPGLNKLINQDSKSFTQLLFYCGTLYLQSLRMKLEYLYDISDGAKYKDVVSENLIRLYDFGQKETTQLIDLMYQQLVIGRQSIDLTTVDFIKAVNCLLILQVSSIDKGVLKTDKPTVFTCELTEQAYMNTIEYMKAAAKSGYNWLCDTSSDDIDFLYSAGGTW